MGGLKFIESQLTRIFEGIAILLTAGLIIVVFLGILDRFLLLTGWSWPEELARFILIWLAFIAFSLCVQKSMHYKVEYLVEKMAQRKLAIYIELMVLVIAAVITLIIGIKGFFFAADAQGQTAPALRIPMSTIYSSIPVSALLMLFFMGVRFVEKIKDLNRGENR